LLCKDVSGLLLSFANGKTGGKLRDDIARHLAVCEKCAQVYREMSGREPDPPPKAPREHIPFGTLWLLAVAAAMLGLTLGMSWKGALRPLWLLWLLAWAALVVVPGWRFLIVSPIEPPGGVGLWGAIRLRTSYLSPLQQTLAIAARFPAGILLGSLLPAGASAYAFIPALIAAAALAKPVLDILRPGKV